MTSSKVREEIVENLRTAQRAFLEIGALCEREKINFVGGVPTDVGQLAASLDPDAVSVVRGIP